MIQSSGSDQSSQTHNVTHSWKQNAPLVYGADGDEYKHDSIRRCIVTLWNDMFNSP